MKPYVVISIIVAALAAVAIGVPMLRKADPSQPVLITSPYAPGQFLAATRVEWTTLWGHHALTLDLSTTRDSISFSFPEGALVSICDEILQRMPHAPAGVRKAEVYRINIRKAGYDEVANTMKVADGRCAEWKTGTVRFPNYPPPLQDWELKSFQPMPKAGDGMIFVFSAVPGSKGEIGDTTFADACQAVLSEPVLIGRKVLEQLAGKIVRIRLAKDRGVGLLRFGTWQADDFRIVSGACVPVEEGRKT